MCIFLFIKQKQRDKFYIGHKKPPEGGGNVNIPYMVLTIYLKYVINNSELTTILKQIRMEYAELDKRDRIVGFIFLWR